MTPQPPRSTLFPYTTLFRSQKQAKARLLGDITIERQSHDITDRENARAENNPPSAVARCCVDERKQHPDRACQTEMQDAQNFAVQEKNLGGNEFERLKHKQEVPFGLDAGGGRGEGVGLASEAPGINGRESAEYAERDVPGHGFAQK